MLNRSTTMLVRPPTPTTPTRRGLIPREALVALVVASPLLAVLLTKSALYGGWPVRAHVIAGVFACALAMAVSLHAVFDGLLVRLPHVTRRHPARFVTYWVAAVLVVACITFLFRPVFAWMDLSFDPTRRFVQAMVIVSFYLAASLVFKRMSERIADERNQVLAERTAALHARFQALQAQTNPHFLFNTLNSVMSLIGKDPTRAEQVLGRLATLLRYSIEGADRPHVSLREELEAVRDYLEIEQVRFGERLNVEVQVGADVHLAVRVPPMVLQPLVENAVLHGVSRSVKGGRIEVRVSCREPDLVELTVDDDVASGASSPHTGTKTSLSNLEERLHIVYGAQATLSAGPRDGGGFRAQITLPRRPQ